MFEAIDERADGCAEHVALKLLNPVLGSGPSGRDAILRKARITQQLEHPSIVRVLGSGTEQGYAWIATELIEGDSLERRIDGGLSRSKRIEQAIELGLQIAAGLEHAHARNVLHRDLKPANVMIDQDGRAKLLDFGLAQREGPAFGVSHTGDVVGTPLYMPPEQLRGARDIDGRADLYALGLVLLELATGTRLLLRDNAIKIMAGIARGKQRLGRRYFAGLPKDLAGVLSRCLEPARRDRYKDARALIHDLEALRDGKAPRLGRLGSAARALNGIARRPARCAGIAGMFALASYGAFWASQHLPLSFTIDSISPRPTGIRFDGEPAISNLPLTLSTWKRGGHRVEFFDGTYRYPFDIDVNDDGTRIFYLPFGPIYPDPQSLIAITTEVTELSVAFVQVGVRAADHGDHHQSLRVKLSGVPGIHQAVGGICTFPLEIREQPYLLHIESEGYSSRDVPIVISDGRTRSVMVELDRVDSPWHTVLVGNALDPALELGLSSMDNLTLRWENAQRDSYTDGLVRRVGLGVIDESREGLVEFQIPLPCRVEELQLLAMTNPELGGKSHLGQTVLVEMGPSAEQLITVFGWPESPRGALNQGGPIRSDARKQLSLLMKQTKATELHVRYRAQGTGAWLLRTNALPRRTLEGGYHWEPALVLRVRAPGTDDELPESFSPGDLVEERKAERVIDLAAGQDVLAFDQGEPGKLIPFEGEFLSFNLDTGSDTNGDGVSDFAIAATFGSDRVEIRSGRDDRTLLELVGSPGDDFGHSIIFVPDMDGDGLDDLLIGASQGSHSDSDGPGYLRLVSGKTGATLSERVGARLRGACGWCAAFVGDFDGQGSYAVISSSTEREAGGWGSAKLFSLPGLRELAHFQGHEQFDFFGNMCAAAGDVNAEGIPDFLIGAPCEESPTWDGGLVYIYSGSAADGYPLLRRVPGTTLWGKIGESVGPVGDIDADGYADWLACHNANYTSVISGKTGRPLHVIHGGADHGRTATATPQLVGDMDGDGQADIAVPRSERYGPGPEDVLRTAVVYSGISGQPLLELRAGGAGPAITVAPAPDLDGDGRADLLVGLGRPASGGRNRLLFVLTSSL